jgi:hypothetical protein
MYAGKLIALESPGALKEATGQRSMEGVFVTMIEQEEQKRS